MPWSCLPAAIQQVTDHRSLQAQSVWLAIHHTDAPRLPPVSFFVSSCRRRAPTERSNKCYHVWIEKKPRQIAGCLAEKMPEAESRCASRSLLSRPLRRRRHHHHSRRQQPPSPIYLKHVGVYVIPPTCTSIPAKRLGVEQPSFRPGHAPRTPAQFVSAAAARATVVSPTADFLLHPGLLFWEVGSDGGAESDEENARPRLPPQSGFTDRLGYKQGPLSSARLQPGEIHPGRLTEKKKKKLNNLCNGCVHIHAPPNSHPGILCHAF